MKISEDIFKLNEIQLLALETAGSITIKRPPKKESAAKATVEEVVEEVQTQAPVVEQEPIAPPVDPEPVVEVPVVEATPVVTQEGVPEHIVSQLPESVAEIVKPQGKKGKK